MILHPSRRRDNPTSPVVATASGLLKYLTGRLRLGKLLEDVEDGRDPSRVSIPKEAVLRAVLGGFLLGIGSLRGVEDRLRHSPGFRCFVGHTTGSFSDDTLREVLCRLDPSGLLGAIRQTASLALLRWGAGRYLESQLAKRLRQLGCSHLVARAVVAIDGHETFCTEKTACADCRTRTKLVKRGGELVKVEERYHQIVVAQQVGSHPAVVLDVERVLPGEGESIAAYRLIARLGKLYGPKIGTLVVDAGYDHEPFRFHCQQAGFRYVVRHKDERRQPGGELAARLAARLSARPLAERERPDGRHKDAETGKLYEYWHEREPHLGRSYVLVRRTDASGNVMTGALVTNLPLEELSPLAAGFIMEARWWIENTGFHELAGQMDLDRAFVHQDRATGAWAVVLLALLAFNAWQLYVYRHLGLDARKPSRTWGDLRRDLWESLASLCKVVRGPRTARAP